MRRRPSRVTRRASRCSEGGDEWGVAYVLANLGIAAFEEGDVGRAEAMHEESLALYGGLRDRSGAALALISLGDVARERGEEARAVALYEDALALHRELGNERGAARALERLSAERSP